ncbi:MAG: phosphoglycerate dehydrogenase [Planctomycetes bacterium]|nr:phosphoglycerate dehydrogenase [Planctomycetota bacterium]
MTVPRVLVSDPLAEEGMALLRQASGVEVFCSADFPEQDLSEVLQECDGVIIRSGTHLTADILEPQRRLQVIVRAGVGVDNIAVPIATRRGIIVMNTPAGNTTSTAEHTIALLLALSRNVAPACESLLAGKWERHRFTGIQLAGKILGIVGLGRVGLAVARRALGLDMKIIGYDPYLSSETAEKQGVHVANDLQEVLSQCDFLTVHTPLTSDTRALIGEEEIAQMRSGVRILNCARGGIIDEEALYQGLKQGHIGGAALDVFQEEPPNRIPLMELSNVLVTPHLAASTAEAQASVAVEAAQLIVDYLTTGAVRYAVNTVPIDQTELRGLRLYLNMAWRLGLFHAQYDEGGIRRVCISYRGEIAMKETRWITAAFTAGLLQTALSESVNFVNAELLARERGIEIIEQTSQEGGDFTSLMHTEVLTDVSEYVASGTLFGQQFLRLVQLGPFHLDTYLDGKLLLFTHRDIPGLVGFIGTIFGKHQVNIAQMTVGRQRTEPGGDALAVLNLDSEPSEDALIEVAAHPDIRKVSVVKLPDSGIYPPWLIADREESRIPS